MAVIPLAVVVPPAQAASMGDYVEITGYNWISSTSFSVTYTVHKAPVQIADRYTLKITNVHYNHWGSPLIVEEKVPLSESVGAHTLTYTGEPAILDTLKITLKYQEYVTLATYTTKYSSTDYRLFGPDYSVTWFHTVTQAEVNGEYAGHAVMAAALTLASGGLSGAATAGKVLGGYMAVYTWGDYATATECSRNFVGNYVKMTERSGRDGSSFLYRITKARWTDQAEYDRRPGQPDCVAEYTLMP